MNWVYETSEDNSARYVLGQIFNPNGKTVLCFGINPSTACPECLDNTVRKVVTIANNNGYENWIMLNIYPQRATNPNDMHTECDEDLVKKNLHYISEIAEKYGECDVWLAYGNLISKRKYLKSCLDDIISLLTNQLHKRLKVIKLTKSNNPVHPLYQLNNSVLVDYIM